MEIIRDKHKYSLQRVVEVMLDNQTLAIQQCKCLIDYVSIHQNLPTTNLKKCEFVHKLVRANVKFKKNPNKYQMVINPYALLEMKVGDCKSFSMIVHGLLCALNLKPKLRYVSYDNDPQPSHVYVIVDNVCIDATVPEFDKEYPYTFKYDY